MEILSIKHDTAWVATDEAVFGFAGERFTAVCSLIYNLLRSLVCCRLAFSCELLNEDKSARISACLLSSDNCYVICGYTNKDICVWDATKHVLIGKAKSPKHPTALAITSLPGFPILLLIADKGGEVHGMDFPLLNRKVRLFGHTSSIITSMLVAPDNKHIICGDRDEKIRVTCFPQTEIISSFCLGHTDVITSLAELSSNSDTPNGAKFIASSSWDKTIRIWNYVSGEQIDFVSVAISDSIEADKRISVAENEDMSDDGVDFPADVPDIEEKSYDIMRAGIFPFKVVTAVCTSSAYLSVVPVVEVIAVLFWEFSSVRILPLCVNSDTPKFKPSRSDDLLIPLKSTPCDIKFIQDDATRKVILVCLLAAPASDQSDVPAAFNIQCFEIKVADENMQLSYIEIDLNGTEYACPLPRLSNFAFALSDTIRNKGNFTAGVLRCLSQHNIFSGSKFFQRSVLMDVGSREGLYLLF